MAWLGDSGRFWLGVFHEISGRYYLGLLSLNALLGWENLFAGGSVCRAVHPHHG